MDNNQQLTDLKFDAWVDHVFDHPVVDPAWHWDISADVTEPSPATSVGYLTKLFKSADTILARFSDEQLNQAFWYLASNACSNYMFALLEDGVAWPKRQECIRSIGNLFERVFAKRCSEHLSHLDEPGANPLNSACYMWWDSFPSWGDPADASCLERDAEILEVMRKTLSLDSIACQEAALHGLGHWHMHYLEQTETIIDDYLQRDTDLRVKLKDYAHSARRGYMQ